MPIDRDRPTMQDIADHVGVSKALVSLVFRNAPGPSAETRKRVLAAADELGYRVNRAAALMTARRSHLIGVMANIRSTFHAELVEDIVAEADRYGYEVVLGAVTPTHAEPAVVETLLSFRCEALILLGPELADDTMAELARRAPVVVIGRRMSASTVDVVRTADGRGIGQVVDHLVELGHRRICHLSGGAGTIARRPQSRLRARDEAARAFGRHRHHQRRFHRALRHARRAGTVAPTTSPDRGLCANDQSAIGLLDKLLRAGIDVPGDIAVAGYDDSTLARLAHIDLTTVSQEPRQQAECAVRAVVERLDENRQDRLDVLLEPRLVVRHTTAPQVRQLA